MSMLSRVIPILLGGALSLGPTYGLTFETTVIERDMALGQETLRVEFPFKNETEQVITLLQIQADCGCTTARLEQTSLQPGEAGAIPVTFFSQGREGQQSLRIRITTSSETNPLHTLTLRTYVPTFLRVNSRAFFWRRGEPIEAKELIANTQGDHILSWEVLDAAADHFTITETREDNQTILSLLPLNTSERLTHRIQLQAKKEGEAVATLNVFLLVR
jgi:hypothetical protein